MKQPLYIQAAIAISPQHTFDKENFLSPVMSSDNGKLFITGPDFREFINPVAIRRMSRLMKMAISAAMKSLKDAGVTEPNAIITGTGRGSMSDMEHFLNDMITMNEGAMNPTSFIQSTYNSPNGWIAMQAKSTAYNQTYVHRGSSLELALMDAQLLFAESTSLKTALVGSYDEITDEYYIIKGKIGYFKKPAPESRFLLQVNDTPGTIGGEGAAFFTVSNEPGTAKSVIEEIVLLQYATAAALANAAAQVIANAGLSATDIDVVLTGRNGDCDQEKLYTDVLAQFPETTTIAGFKHLCGEYDTATGFGIWLADWLLQQDAVPETIVLKQGFVSKPKNILLVNHYILGSASVMLVRAC